MENNNLIEECRLLGCGAVGKNIKSYKYIIVNFLTFKFQPSWNVLQFKTNIQNITKHKYCNENHINDNEYGSTVDIHRNTIQQRIVHLMKNCLMMIQLDRNM
jgi:hypothetical protein